MPSAVVLSSLPLLRSWMFFTHNRIHLESWCKISMLTSTLAHLPFFAEGVVVKGFGRGSKDLGIPTANLPSEVVDKLPHEMETGIYYGFANVDRGPVYKMVMSIGWNPYFKNTKKSMEAHIMHQFPKDFYGSLIKICLLGYIRPERSFDSLDALIDAIKADIAYADSRLALPEHVKYQEHSFFKDPLKVIENGGHHHGSNL